MSRCKIHFLDFTCLLASDTIAIAEFIVTINDRNFVSDGKVAGSYCFTNGTCDNKAWLECHNPDGYLTDSSTCQCQMYTEEDEFGRCTPVLQGDLFLYLKMNLLRKAYLHKTGKTIKYDLRSSW